MSQVSSRETLKLTYMVFLTSFLILANVPTALAIDQDTSQCHGCAMENTSDIKTSNDDKAKVLLAAVEKDPHSSIAHLALGLYYEGKNLLRPAILEYEESARLDPKQSEPLLRQIGLLLKLQEFDSADQLLDRAERNFPQNHQFAIAKIASLTMQHKGKMLEEYSNKLLSISHPSIELLVVQATILAKHKKYSESNSICDHALHERPSYFPAIVLKGYTLERLGRHQDAFIAYQNYFTDTQYNAIFCKMYLQLLLKEKRDDLLLEPVLALLALTDPNNKVEYTQVMLLSTALLAVRSDSESERAIARVREKLDDKLTAALFQKSIGEIYDRTGRTDDALRHFIIELSLKSSIHDYLRVADYSESRALDMAAALSVLKSARNSSDPLVQKAASKVITQQQLEQLERRIARIPNDPSWQFKVMLQRLMIKSSASVSLVHDLTSLQREVTKVRVSRNLSVTNRPVTSLFH